MSATVEKLFGDSKKIANAHGKGIGGSNAGTILGVNEWQTPLELYKRMKGELPRVESNDLMVMGTLSEQGLRVLFEMNHGKPIRQSHLLHRHPEHDWMVAHIDGLVQGEDAGWEAKTATFRTFHKWGPSGSDEVPMSYLAQCIHYMAVLNKPVWYLSVWLGGAEYRQYTIERDPELERRVIDAESVFWYDHYLKDVPPPAQTLGDVILLHPKAEAGSEIRATPELEDLITELSRLKGASKDNARMAGELEFEIKRTMGDAEAIVGADGKPMVTWKNRSSRRIDTTRLKREAPDLYDRYLAESTSRTFSLK